MAKNNDNNKTNYFFEFLKLKAEKEKVEKLVASRLIDYGAKNTELEEKVRYLTQKLQRKNEYIERLENTKRDHELCKASSTKSYQKLRKQFKASANYLLFFMGKIKR